MKTIKVEVKAKYRGFKISFSEHNKQWYVTIDKERDAYSNEDLEKVKDYVDKFLKGDFKPFEALCTVGWGKKYRKVTITSVDIEGAVWIQEVDAKGRGSRSKVDKDDLVAITPENEARIKRIEELETAGDKIHDEKEREEKKLTQPAL